MGGTINLPLEHNQNIEDSLLQTDLVCVRVPACVRLPEIDYNRSVLSLSREMDCSYLGISEVLA